MPLGCRSLAVKSWEIANSVFSGIHVLLYFDIFDHTFFLLLLFISVL